MKILTIGLSILAFYNTAAQQFQGKANYFSKTQLKMDFGNRQLSEDQKKVIEERMKSASERTFVLTFDKQASTYVEETQLSTSATPGRGRLATMMSGLTSVKYYKNIKDRTYHDQREFYGKNFLICDSLIHYNWQLVNETKKIGNYTCFKAVTTKKVSETLDWQTIRRKGRELRAIRQNSQKKDTISNRKPMPLEIEVVAWYTPEIPVSTGPGSYWGLPGLILEIQEGRTITLCNKIVIITNGKEEIKIPKKGKKLSQKEFDLMAEKKIEEMIDQVSTQRRAGFGGQGRN